MQVTNPLLPVAAQPYTQTIQKGQVKTVQKGVIDQNVDMTIKSEQQSNKSSKLDTFKKWFQKSSCCCCC